MLISFGGMIRYEIENVKTIDSIHDELLEFSAHFVKMIEDQPATVWEVDVRVCNEHCGFRCWNSSPILREGNEDGLEASANIVEGMNVFKVIFAHINRIVADREIRLLEYDSAVHIELRLLNENFLAKMPAFESLHSKIEELGEDWCDEENMQLIDDIHTLVVENKLSRKRKLSIR